MTAQGGNSSFMIGWNIWRKYMKYQEILISLSETKANVCQFSPLSKIFRNLLNEYDDNFLIWEWNTFCTGDANFYMNSILFLGILLHLIIHSSK